MEFLRDRYRVFALSEVIHRIENRLPLPDRTACLTFDDEFRSVYTCVWPILSQYQLPATAFVVTCLPDTGMPPWPGRVLYALANTTLSAAKLDGVEWKLSKDREGAAIYGRIPGNEAPYAAVSGITVSKAKPNARKSACRSA
jgi:hypothetical protein